MNITAHAQDALHAVSDTLPSTAPASAAQRGDAIDDDDRAERGGRTRIRCAERVQRSERCEREDEGLTQRQQRLT